MFVTSRSCLNYHLQSHFYFLHSHHTACDFISYSYLLLTLTLILIRVLTLTLTLTLTPIVINPDSHLYLSYTLLLFQSIVRSNIPWMKCAPLIIPAKRRLLGFIKELCSSQEDANDRYAKNDNKREREHISSSSTSIILDKKRQRGVIYTGKAEHFHDIYQSIYSIRLLNVSLPVEIWVNSKDEKMCSNIFNSIAFPDSTSTSSSQSNSGITFTPAPGTNLNSEKTITDSNFILSKNNKNEIKNRNNEENEHKDKSLTNSVKCKKLPNFVEGFTSKFYSLLYTSFSDVLFIDADNIVVNNINIIFDSVEYKSTGSIIWPDLWGNKCRFDRNKNNKHPGESSYENHVFYKANFGGLKWKNNRKYSQESETGQIAFDLTRHRGLLDLGRKFIEDKKFLKIPINGDKDIFRFIFLISGQEFSYVSHFPGYSYYNYHRDCLVHFFGSLSTASSSSSSSSTSSNNIIYNYSTSFDKNNDNTNQVNNNKIHRNEFYEVPMFFHQLKIRDPNAFQQILRIPPNNRDDPSGCLSMGVLPDNVENMRNEKEIRISNRRFLRNSNRNLLKSRIRNNLNSSSINDDKVLENKGKKNRNNHNNNNSDNINKNSNNINFSRNLFVDNEFEVEVDTTDIPKLILDSNFLGPESVKRKYFAKKLFEEVDYNWKKNNCDNLLWWHQLSIKSSLYPYMPWFLKKKNNGIY